MTESSPSPYKLTSHELALSSSSQSPHQSQSLLLALLKVHSSSDNVLVANPNQTLWASPMETDKSINDLPQDLMREILWRLPVKCLLLSRGVCKTWLYLISDPYFAKSHFGLAAAPTRRCLVIQRYKALSYDLDALFHDGCAAVKFSLPAKKPSAVVVLESCRGFVMLDEFPHFIIWNPSTGARKRISYKVQRLLAVFLYGFGYDAANDDYLVVLGWTDKNREDHFEFFSMRTNSWKNFEVALPTPSPRISSDQRCGLFLNGAFHWLAGRHCPIVVFDLKERSFSKIPLPRVPLSASGPCRLMELEGCLALSFYNKGGKSAIQVMKEYKVQSSWTSYVNFHIGFNPISLSGDGDIIGYDARTRGFSKYNVSRQKLEHLSGQLNPYAGYAMYTESLLSLPNYSKCKKKGRRVRQECFEQVDAVADSNHIEVKESKRIRRAPTWTHDFYCN